MPKYRKSLPQLSREFFITDGGLETTMVFHQGFELPHFAAIDLMRRSDGINALRDYYRRYAGIAKAAAVGFFLESPTWRSSRAWAPAIGCSEDEFVDLNKRSIEMLEDIRREFETPESPMVISAAVGPRGDGYSPANMMTLDESVDYHSWQVGGFADTNADMISALTMNYVEEAAGIAIASRSAGLPCVISFTVETDGRVPTGQSLKEAIEEVEGLTEGSPVYYMINCAHTTHFEPVLDGDEPWILRIRGFRANASTKSHAELDESTELDAGDPIEFGRQSVDLMRKFPHMNVVGGCCGTDTRHIGEICKALGRRR